MESELWNLAVKKYDLATYTQRFQELTMLYTRMVLEEEDRIERYVRGLPDNIQENVMSAEPTRLQDAIRLANKNQSQNGNDGDNGNGRNRNGENGNPNKNNRGDRHVARECTYQDFMKCQPLNFMGTK
nr:hypothetical protein [Tanacetum cinerariifolium]